MPPTSDTLRDSLVDSLHRYFRVELEGDASHIPDWRDRPVMFVMNHTALLGLEVYLLYSVLRKLRPDAPRPRTTVWPPFLEVPLLGAWYRAGGCIAASVDGAANALRAGESVLFLPEGPDATDIRDEVGPFHAGFLRVIQTLAGEIEVPVVPLGWCGVDEANPWWVTTNPTAVRLLMKPVMPRFDFALIPRPPLLRPSKVVFSVGAPIALTAADLETEQALRAQAARIRTVVVDLVGRASRVRAQRIADSRTERLVHGLLRMNEPRWPRRS